MELIKRPLGFMGTDFNNFLSKYFEISILAYYIFSLDVTSWDISAVCRENPPGNYAHPDLCSYIECGGLENMKVKSCPRDSIFNPEFQVCIPAPKGSYLCECKYPYCWKYMNSFRLTWGKLI